MKLKTKIWIKLKQDEKYKTKNVQEKIKSYRETMHEREADCSQKEGSQ